MKNDNFEQTFCTKILRKIFTFFTSHLEKFIILQNMAIKVRISHQIFVILLKQCDEEFTENRRESGIAAESDKNSDTGKLGQGKDIPRLHFK